MTWKKVYKTYHGRQVHYLLWGCPWLRTDHTASDGTISETPVTHTLFRPVRGPPPQGAPYASRQQEHTILTGACQYTKRKLDAFRQLWALAINICTNSQSLDSKFAGIFVQLVPYVLALGVINKLMKVCYEQTDMPESSMPAQAFTHCYWQMEC